MNKQTEYVEKLSAQIVELDAQIELLKDKAKSDTSGAAPDHSDTIGTLQHKRDEAARKLQGIAPVSDNEWDDVKEGSEGVMNEVRDIVHDTITKI